MKGPIGETGKAVAVRCYADRWPGKGPAMGTSCEERRAVVKRIIVTVKEAHGCRVHRPGEQFVFECDSGPCVRVRGTICLGALTSLLPKVYALHNGARFSWAEEDDAVTHACPDPKTPVVFEVRREFGT
jgi:uncharacterized repeat protein (TIGR04076 family)